MGAVLDAALVHHGLDPAAYQDGLDRLRWRSWVPDRLTFSLIAGWHGHGRTQDDAQFADDRYLANGDYGEWRAMAWASWRLPSLAYDHDAVAMQRLRVQGMGDEVRGRIVYTIHRYYGELQRLRARAAAEPGRDLRTRAMERVRIEQLEAVVDLASGGYLSKQRKEPR
jgi:hypothetical protein